ncbi:MAG TPA: AAA family ATPase [Coleofasciculaceae cyanobacterium]|jgi:predicted kinase
MTTLILLIGLPGSGKSSLASKLLAESPQGQLISTDDIRAQLFGSQSIQGPWLLVWRQVQQQFQQAVAHSSMAIYDATNAVRCHRKEAIALARASGFTHITGLWLDTPLQLCLERNRRRERIVPEEVILKMHSCLRDAPPTHQDGLDCLIRSSWARCGNCDHTDEEEPYSINLTTLLL